MKKFISMFLTLAMIFSFCTVTYAAEPAVTDDNNYWGYNGQTVLIDEFTTDAYTIKSFYDGEIVYVVTVLANGETEFVWAPIGGTVRTITFMPNEVGLNNGTDALSSLSDSNFVSAAKAYALSHAAESTIVNVEISTVMEEGDFTEDIVPAKMNQDDYDALMEQLEDIHGEEHDWFNWTGIMSHTVDGLTFEYKENLDLVMNYRNSVAYSAGMTLGSVVASILAHIPGVGAPLAVIAKVLEVAAAVNTYLYATGQIASYYGAAIYERYVMVEGSGPYFECFRTIDYDGWVDEGKPESATLVETAEVYSMPEEIYESYEMQRERAAENYNNQN